MRRYYDRRAAEYDDWWLGTGRFAALDRPGWAAEVNQVVAVLEAWSRVAPWTSPAARGSSPAIFPGAVALDQSARMVEIAAQRLPHAQPVRARRAPAVRGRGVRPHPTGHFYGHLLPVERGRSSTRPAASRGELVIVDSARRPGSRRSSGRSAC